MIGAAIGVLNNAAPAARERDWLRALMGAGVHMSWSGDSIPATAIDVPISGGIGDHEDRQRSVLELRVERRQLRREALARIVTRSAAILSIRISPDAAREIGRRVLRVVLCDRLGHRQTIEGAREIDGLALVRHARRAEHARREGYSTATRPVVGRFGEGLSAEGKWLDGVGAFQPLLSEPQGYSYPRLSPDGELIQVATPLVEAAAA